MTDAASPRLRISASAFLHGLILLSAAAWGLGVAIAFAPAWKRPAPPDQLPGYMKSLGVDARGPFLVIVMVALAPAIAALLARPIAARLSRADSERWSGYAASGALLLGLWSAFILPPPRWLVVLGPVLAVAAITSLRTFRARFSQRDVILLPTFLATFFGLIDLWREAGYVPMVWLAATAVLVVRLLVARFHPGFLPADAFLVSPLGLVFLIRAFGLHQRLGGILVLLVSLGTPPLALRWKLSARRRRLILAYLVYPIVAMSYPHVTNLASAEGAVRASLFEDGHGLMPASEMLRGEKLYHDVSPGHGALTDGVLDYLALKWFGQTLGNALNFRTVLSTVTPLAIYFLGLASTGSPEAGLLAFFFSGMYRGDTNLLIRPAPALLALAFTIVAVRLRRPRALLWAGVMVGLAFVISLEFSVYSGVVAVIAVVVCSGSTGVRMRAGTALAAGLGTVALVLFLVLAAYGVFGAFFRVTFGEILTLGPAYNIGFLNLPSGLANAKSFPEALLAVLETQGRPYQPPGRSYVLWCLVAVMVGAMFARRPFHVSRRQAAVFLIGCWILAAGISYAERHHLYFDFALPTLLVTGSFLLWRSRGLVPRLLAPIATIALIMMSYPTGFLTMGTILRITEGPLDPNFAQYTALPRAHGALLRQSDFPKLAAAQKFISSLGPDQTYFDFANLPLLYFLVDKPSPIRQYEVPHYEPQRIQREIVSRLEGDSTVQAVLISFPVETDRIDGIPNSERAPLVWRYIEAHFEPAFEENGVIFWRRKAS